MQPSWLSNNQSRVIPYGLDPAGFVDGPNYGHAFIYASSPIRGLEQVLLCWPTIYAALNHNATLTVLYGFTPAVLKSLSQERGLDAQTWLDGMMRLLQQPGVRYVGLVNHTQLAIEYSQAGFMLYPTSYPETGCFALMKVRRFVDVTFGLVFVDVCVCVRLWRWVPSP